MYSLVEIGILNAITASVLAIVVWLISRSVRRPALIHALWVLVLLKLVTPPLIEVPVGLRLERLSSFAETNDGPSEVTTPPLDSARPKPESARPKPESARPKPKPAGPNPESARPKPATTILVAQASDTNPPLPPADSYDQSDSTNERVTVETRDAALLASIPASTIARWSTNAIQLLLLVWVAGAILWFAVQGWRITLFARLASTARLAGEEIQHQAERLATKIGLRRVPKIWLLDLTITPLLWAVGSRARVIFPADLLQRVDTDARATLITHELAHYHRGDHWVRLIEFVVTGLFWWHPIVWIARREIEVSEEHCCDAWVVAQFPEQPRRYAEALLDTIDFLSEDRPRVAPLASGLGQIPFLRERMRLIMLGVAPKSMSGTTRLAVLTAAAFCLPLGPQVFEGAIRRADAAMALSANYLEDNKIALFDPDPATSTTLPTAPALAVGSGLNDTISFEPYPAEELIEPSAPESTAWAVVNSPDGRFQAIAKTDGELILRDTFQKHSFDLSEYQISSIAFVPHRDLLAAGSSGSKVYLFDCASGEPMVTFTGHRAGVGSVAVSLDGRFVVSGSRDGEIKLWDIDYESEVTSRIPSQFTAINCVRFSPDGRLLAIASGDWMTPDGGSVVLWDLRGGSVKKRFMAQSPIGAIAFEADQLVVAEWGGRTTRWAFGSGSRVEAATVSIDTVSAAAFAADAQSLLIAASHGEQLAAMPPAWFQRMDRDRDGQLAWSEFAGPRGTFRKLDVDANQLVTRDEASGIIQ